MKKLFLSSFCIVALGLASFTYANQPEVKTVNEIFEVESYISVDETVNCRWRTCTVSGGTKDCGEWTYGTCEKDGNGTLTPNAITEAP